MRASDPERATPFDRTTMVTRRLKEAGRFDVDLELEWGSPRGVHGGDQCAIAVRGAAALVPGREVRTFTTSFVRSARVGAAILAVRRSAKAGPC